MKYIKKEELIEFEKAIKTFIPEYVECINPNGWIHTIKKNNGNLIFDTKIESIHICDNSWKKVIKETTASFKPSTKEAYDAQFVVKEVEPLPQFKVIETIKTITKVENNEGNQFFIGDIVISSNGTIQTITSFDYNKARTNIIAFTNKQSILGNGIGIDKIEHYIEPKTDYKILEYKTESGISCKAPFLADSHQFYINERCKIHSIKRISDDLIITVGDEVLSKTCSVPNKILSIELINNKIRLYPRNSFYNLEDILKKKVGEETLLEKAKRLYPVGTKFNNYKLVKGGNWTVEVLTNNIIKESGTIKLINPEFPINNNRGSWTLYENGEWAEIINN